MTLMETVKGALGEMTRSERQVAAHYFGHASDFAFFTLDKIAAAVGTSTTSVLRFCRRLGFAGYKDFQQAVQGQIHRQPDLMDKFQRTRTGAPGDALLEKTVRLGVECVQKTFAGIPYDRIWDAVQRIARAKRVFTFGMKESFALAHYACSRFTTVREEVHLLGAGMNGDVECMLDLTPEDVCLVYLFHRYTKQSLAVLEMLKKQGVCVILVTSAPYGQLEPYAAVLLACHVDADGIKNTALAPVCLADYLCNAVAVQLGDAALRRMQQLETLFREHEILGD